MAHHTKILKAQERKRIGFPTDEVNLYISLIENNYYNYLMYEFREYKKFYSKSIEPLSPAEAAVETEINFLITYFDNEQIRYLTGPLGVQDLQYLKEEIL